MFCMFPSPGLHTESAISISPSLVRDALLLAGEADLPRFSTLSVDRAQLPALALCVLCLRMCVCVLICLCVCVCEGKREGEREGVSERELPVCAAASSLF